jgi:iron complex transport system substrate-binding protein
VIARLTVILGFLVSPVAWAAIDLVDDAGQKLHLPLPPKRIVSLAPHVTELVFAVGAGAQLVGTDSASDYPQTAQALPRIGDSSRVNFERIAVLKPDLIIAWASGNRAADLHALRRMGIPVLVTEAHRLADVARLLRLIGRASAHSESGEAAAQAFEQRLRTLKTCYAHRKPLRVFYQVWERPLMTVGGRHWIGDAMALCGGLNVFADLHAASPTVSLEAVLARAPEVIVSGSDGPDSRLMWQRFPRLPAVRRGALVRIDADTLHRPTPRLLDGATALCQAIGRYQSSPQAATASGHRGP